MHGCYEDANGRLAYAPGGICDGKASYVAVWNKEYRFVCKSHTDGIGIMLKTFWRDPSKFLERGFS